MKASTTELAPCDTAALRALLREEASAVETYTQAMSAFAEPELIEELQRIRDEHSRAVRSLRDLVVESGVIPLEEKGVWESVRPVIASHARRADPRSVLSALSRGEDHNRAACESALRNDSLPPHCLAPIRTELLPACERHKDELSRLSAAVRV